MSQFLATLHSPMSERGALAIFDTENKSSYLQYDDMPKWLSSHQLRGLAHHDGNLYVTTPSSIVIFSIKSNSKLPVFRPHKEIVLQEWIIGSSQADLLGVLVSKSRECLLVANNLFNSIDELTLDGSFIKRTFLHQISPELFPIPREVNRFFKYGHVRSIIESPNGEIFLTIHGLNNSARGCVVSFNTGEVYLDNLQAPHGALFLNRQFLIQEAGFGRLSSYATDQNYQLETKASWSVEPEASVSKHTHSAQVIRGMVRVGNAVYCGVYHPDSEVEKNAPPYITSFDIHTGKQGELSVLPDNQGFLLPRVFYMASMPVELEGFELPQSRILVNSKKAVNLSVLATKNIQVFDAKSSLDIAPSAKAVVVLDKVSLFYRRTAISLFSFKKEQREAREFRALNNVSFVIHEGETVGIIGRNGAGKSTISMLMTGALKADKGRLDTRGRVQLLSIGLGFQPKLTGRENVFINGALLGLSKVEMMAKIPDIESFAEIGDFIDEPVRTYSAGMRSRLGFAVATAVRPDILILDEILSTGDAAFREKANKRMVAMRDRTKTIIMVSHNSNLIRQTCSRVIWLHMGQLVMDGPPDIIFPHYHDFCKDPKNWMDRELQKLTAR